MARVAVDVALAHLDRLFDYRIPEKMAEDAVPGVKVRVRFSGRLVDGWLLELGTAEPVRTLSPLHAVVSTEPILTPQARKLIRGVADHYAGVWPDVARLAIPPRHATTEKAKQRTWDAPGTLDRAQVLPGFPDGESFLEVLRAGRSPRAFWQVPNVHGGPGDAIGGTIEAVDATLASGRSAIVVVPTARELNRFLPRFQGVFGKGAVAVLSAELGRSARYRNYLACVRGQARVVIGTRSAAFDPLENLGLIVVFDEGNDAHHEPRAPHPHSRSVAVLRSHQSACGLLFASHGRSAEAQHLIESGWLHSLELTPGQTRRVSPPVRVVGDDPGREPAVRRLRIPSSAFRLLSERLPSGPILVQVPLRGQFASLSCSRCGNRAVCQRCSAPLRMPSKDVVVCSFCAHQPTRWECPYCHSTSWRHGSIGDARTAEELARAFPGVLAVNSSADRMRDEVPDEPAIVVATPGAEPAAPTGYAAVLILDTAVTLARSDLRVEEEALRRWSSAIAMCRPPEDGGTIQLVGDSQQPVLQALVRADVPGFISGVLADRSAAKLPPAVKAVRVGGDPEALADFLDNDPFEAVEILGPTKVRASPEPESAALLRVPLAEGKELLQKVRNAAAIRSARKEGGRLYIQVDPESLE